VRPDWGETVVRHATEQKRVRCHCLVDLEFVAIRPAPEVVDPADTRKVFSSAWCLDDTVDGDVLGYDDSPHFILLDSFHDPLESDCRRAESHRRVGGELLGSALQAALKASWLRWVAPPITARNSGKSAPRTSSTCVKRTSPVARVSTVLAASATARPDASGHVRLACAFVRRVPER
jgi:hypothetical protein